MDHDKENILDYFPEDHEQREMFNKDDIIVLARIFNDKLESQMAASRLRVLKIPHFIADGNANIFTENVLAGERLFVRKEDLEIVGEELKQIKTQPYEGEESWYQEVRTQQGYEPYRQMTYLFLGAFAVFALILVLIYSGILD